MVEKHGTDGMDITPQDVDTNEKKLEALYASKPKLPHPCTHEQHEQYIKDLAVYYVWLLDLDSLEYGVMALLKYMYADGFTAREFVF